LPSEWASCSLLDQLQLEQVGAEAAAVEHLPVQRFLETLLGEVAFRDEDLADLCHSLAS